MIHRHAYNQIHICYAHHTCRQCTLRTHTPPHTHHHTHYTQYHHTLHTIPPHTHHTHHHMQPPHTQHTPTHHHTHTTQLTHTQHTAHTHTHHTARTSCYLLAFFIGSKLQGLVGHNSCQVGTIAFKVPLQTFFSAYFDQRRDDALKFSLLRPSFNLYL